MGGKVPLGYDVRERKLVVNEVQAQRVRRVFELFAETGSGLETVRRLRDEGVAAKSGRPLNRCDVYKLLNNRTYTGEVAHKGKVYPGEHQAIVPREPWEAILDGRQPERLGLPRLLEPFPIGWNDQRNVAISRRVP